MKESLTYQAILAEGRAEREALGQAKCEAIDRAVGEAEGKTYGARRILILIGTHRLGRRVIFYASNLSKSIPWSVWSG